jgi:predicted nucleic acid-binding protein
VKVQTEFDFDSLELLVVVIEFLVLRLGRIRRLVQNIRLLGLESDASLVYSNLQHKLACTNVSGATFDPLDDICLSCACH